jgi:hypothetical protein
LNHTNWLFSSHLGSELPMPPENVTEERRFLPAVSTSLALATGIGLIETVALILGSGTLMNMISVPIVRKTLIFSQCLIAFAKKMHLC